MGDQTPPLCIHNRERLEPGSADPILPGLHGSFFKWYVGVSEKGELAKICPVLNTRAEDRDCSTPDQPSGLG